MPEVSPPRQYVVHKPSGDPDAARRLAAAYDALAAAVLVELRIVSRILDNLGPSWRGQGGRATHAPAAVLSGDASRVADALRRSGDDLRHYAHRLARAHAQHGWSLGRLVTLGAVVTVGVTAVVVTMGAAAPAEAVAAAAAVESAEAATAAAGAAGSTAATGLASWQAMLAGVRPLTPFLVPHLISAGGSVGFEAVSQTIGGHGLDLHSLEVAAAVGFAGSSAGSAVERQLASSPKLVRRAAEAATWTANGTAGGYADHGDVDLADSAAFGLTGFVARDIRFATDEARLIWKLRVPQLPLGFASKRDWRRFVTTLYDGLDRAGYRDAVVAFRGSSITGFNYRNGFPFDADHRSDWDLALVHRGALRRALDGGIRSAGGRTRTAPLSNASDVEMLGLSEVTSELRVLACRPVTWMIYQDTLAVQQRSQPYLIVPRP